MCESGKNAEIDGKNTEPGGMDAPTFISWSGMRARRFARALRGLLEATGDYFHPWVSETDIPLGVNWRSEVDETLRSAKAGIVILTPENYRSPWLIYEAGRMVERGITVIPIRVDLPMTMLPRDFPLIEQSAGNTQDGIREVARALNQVTHPRLSTNLVDQRFDMAWSDFGEDLERPDAVFRGKTLQDRQFCQEVFLDIAKESMAASCRSLMLYAECSRIIALTDWSKWLQPPGHGREEQGTSDTSPEHQEVRESLAREFQVMRHMIQAALSESSSVGSEQTTNVVRSLVIACEKVHKIAIDCHIQKFVKTQRDGDIEETKLAEFAKLSCTYRELRRALAMDETCATDKLSAPWQTHFEQWRETLPPNPKCDSPKS